MASIHREVVIEASAAHAWSALEDMGALHTRLVPGFVVDTKLEYGPLARIVTFGNGLVARERIVDCDAQARRLVWSAESDRLTHHNASAQVFDEGPSHCRFVWIADLLPHEAAPAIAAMIESGLATIKTTLERSARG